MISYAVSLACVNKLVTPLVAEALRKTKFRNVEISLNVYAGESPDIFQSKKLTRNLIKEGTIYPASAHLPFGGVWDPSSPEEARRKCNVACFANLIRENCDLIGPNLTLHGSAQPALAEHPVRLEQLCRSIEELMPLAQELDFSINVEYLPRTCIGNSVEELQKIMTCFDKKYVGICFDVNHVMNQSEQLPELINQLAPYIKTFHINDYDNVDETHWVAGQGCIDWISVMKEIKKIPQDVLFIHETVWQLQSNNHHVDPIWQLRDLEKACWFLENCEKIIPEIRDFQIPGN